MDYKKKLEDWNNTDKYRMECSYLIQRLNVVQNDVILDYGCGIGTMIKRLKGTCVALFGYDVNQYMDDDLYFLDKIDFRFTKIYFMHSFAHIPNIKEVLIKLKDNLIGVGEIHIITPSKNYLDKLSFNPNYIPDPTVHKHYTINELISLFNSCGYSVSVRGGLGDTVGGERERIYFMAKKYKNL